MLSALAPGGSLAGICCLMPTVISTSVQVTVPGDQGSYLNDLQLDQDEI